ncbi:MAG TPA: BNR-4 repeat-containing protein, partial [Tepidisphaeraceae bacterium]
NNTLRYRVSDLGALTNPGSTTWSTALFTAPEQSTLLGSAVPSSLTYPMFVRTPGGDLQLFIRSGGSGGGSLWEFGYSGSTHSWNAGHQIDDGFTGTYVGTTTTTSASRNDYPNGFSYGADGNLYHTFTYRESATGAANHDLMYVYSPDGGQTWLNNAGTTVASGTLGGGSSGTEYNLNSPGLVVRPLPETQTMMNQNGQAVDHGNHIHAITWHRDSAKDPSLNNVWEPQESSYFDSWRDNLGNWHESRIFGDVGTRPKIVFDANDNAYAVYQVKSDTPGLVGGAGSNGNLYFNNGDLVIAAATKATNWTDWKVIKIEAGPFVSEAAVDAELLNSTGTLAIVMQNSPTVTGNNGTALRSLDYSIAFTPAGSTTLNASGNWSAAGNWSGAAVPGLNTVVNINGGRTATVNSVVNSLDNVVAVGTGGSDGSLLVVSGGSLNLLQIGATTLSGNTSHLNKAVYNTVSGGQIVVGRDSGSVGTYLQTGGAVSAWRFAVGDYLSETSGGGPSTATVSGGSLTTYELDIAFSANGSSSGSSFNVSGGTVTVNGDVIVGEFGNSGSLNLTGGLLTIAGNLREGFNKVNNGSFRMDGGVLDMTGGYVTVDNFIYNGGSLTNITTAPIGTNVNAANMGTMSGMTIGTVLIGSGLGAGSTTTLTIPANVRLAAGSRVELWSGASLALGGGGAAIAIGTTPSFTSNLVNITTGGTLAGDGVVAAAVNNISGTVAPGHSTGILHVTGDFTQGAAGTTEIELGGTTAGSGHDQLSITGTATLAGTMRVKRFGGFVPLPGESFDVMSFASRTGDVALVNQTGLAGLVLSKSYSSTDLTLLASALYGGDADLDGVVDVDDLDALALHWQSSANWLGGDFNGDGIVDQSDLGILAQNWGAGAGGGASLAPLLSGLRLPNVSVPEPTTFALPIAIMLLSPRRWRLRCCATH